MEIYLDVIIIENLIVNYFLIYLMCKTLNIKYSILANIISASVGSLSLLVMLFLPLSNCIQIILKVSIAFLMVYISIKKNINLILKGVCVLFLYTIALGGICIFLKYNETGVMPKNSYVINFTYKKLMLGIIITSMFLQRIILFIKDKLLIKNLIYDVEININGSYKTIKAFLDTGNELREPVTNLPVIIVEEDVFKNVDIKKEEYIIPYRVVGGYGGNLKGVKVDGLRFLSNGENSEVKNGIIAFCNTSLSKTGEYNALLSRGIL